MAIPDKQGSSYILDAENAAELARLVRQARTLLEHIGLVPANLDLSQVQTILDVGCGPGEWACAAARAHPQCSVTGIDISELMLGYAHRLADEQGLENVSFQRMDAISLPLEFPPASFDLIYSSIASSFIPTALWPQFLHECTRLLRVGGIMCCMEMNSLGVSNSPALERYNDLLLEAAQGAGMGLVPPREELSYAQAVERLLRQSGFTRLRQRVVELDISAGAPAHTSARDGMHIGLKLLQPFVLRSGLCMQEELNGLYQQVMQDMARPEFRAVSYFYTIWGVRAPAS
ncbi:class I SAM-dependent methyltransferase [Ktedonosporobacter rubrisoli]|uniref:Class I SAM-dependent methyltransferase n=1 Tax=Ktedonosporobacter rubrisoli TaxID=2509675 RepID=A0A4P6JV52_KTERU|nr:class I SAM-dependent methyltransferase [Ktedonosporobacter rubrisoli]QBD79527.1 class I SAM-dependent methyltransferase [Ktedonosporobacter rubrisoli]